jgi:hypothetical protein
MFEHLMLVLRQEWTTVIAEQLRIREIEMPDDSRRLFTRVSENVLAHPEFRPLGGSDEVRKLTAPSAHAHDASDWDADLLEKHALSVIVEPRRMLPAQFL